MRILKDNLLRATDTVIESGTEDESFLFRNMWDNRLVLQGKITGTVTFDLGLNYADFPIVDTLAIQAASGSALYLAINAGNTPAALAQWIEIINPLDNSGVINLTELTGAITNKYRYFRIDTYLVAPTGPTSTPGGDIYINYLYLGNFLQLPNARAYAEPIIDDTDNETKTVSGQIYTQLGHTYRKVSQKFKLATKEQKDEYYSWYNTSDRANNNIFIQFDDLLETYPPLFGKIKSTNEKRFLGMKYYPFNINFTEAK